MNREADEDAAHMRRALELARRGWGMVQPNPLVGAVIVRDGTVVGEGFHEVYGGPHAEINALQAAGARARGGTLYVTLEPCAHHGKTPPCADTIIDSGIARVVFATRDPNPASGSGTERLRSAGIAITAGVEEETARWLNAAFLHVHECGTPFVALKYAISLDGGLAEEPGVRTQITGPAAKIAMHQLRAGYDAIMLGIGTVLSDDPLLTVRAVSVRKHPVRVIIDTQARLPLESRLVRTIGEAPVWVVCGVEAPRARTEALEAAGVRVLRAPVAEEHVDMKRAIQLLGQHGVHTIFVEGGAALGGTLLRIAAVHRMYIFLAPLFLGPSALPAFGMATPDRDRWRCTSTEWHGADVLVTLDSDPAARTTS